jgi:hypothetical protein
MEVTSLPFNSAVYTPGATVVLVFGLATGGVIGRGVTSGTLGSGPGVVEVPPPHAVTSAAKVRLKRETRQTPSPVGFACRLILRFELDMRTYFALYGDYFIVGT